MLLARSEATTDYAAPIIATVEGLHEGGLDRDDLILDGSGVLALYGIRAPRDADFIVRPSVFDELRAARQTPDGMMLRTIIGRTGRMRVYLQSVNEPEPGRLPIHIKTFERGDREEQFEALRSRVTYSDKVRIAHFSLEQMHFLKTHDSRRTKDRVDAFRIARHVGKPVLQASWLALGRGKFLVNS